MTKLSVNINKIAVVRNSRGGNRPDVVRAALDIERFGADGITVHPRPDARHIRYDDVRALKRVLATEFNIEGNPIDSFVALVEEVRPTQVTLVPDAADAVTSNAGWNTVAHRGFLQTVCERFKRLGIRVSIFVDPVAEMVRGAAACGADRGELYTEASARGYAANDVVLIILWALAAKTDLSCISVVACFSAFLFNDMYGYFNWRKMKLRQSSRENGKNKMSEKSPHFENE